MGLAKRTSSVSLVYDIKSKEPACFGQHNMKLLDYLPVETAWNKPVFYGKTG